MKKSSLHKSSSIRHREFVNKKRTKFRLQDEDLPDEEYPDEELSGHETMQSFSPNASHARQVSDSNVTTRNQYEDLQESENDVDSETYMSDSQQEDNIGSTSHGMFIQKN